MWSQKRSKNLSQRKSVLSFTFSLGFFCVLALLSLLLFFAGVDFTFVRILNGQLQNKLGIGRDYSSCKATGNANARDQCAGKGSSSPTRSSSDSSPMSSPTLSPSHTDPPLVIVVGGGLAGLTTSLSLLDLGVKVILVEKTERLGGNSAKASSGMNAAETDLQRSLGIDDSVPQFEDDTLVSGKGLSLSPLVSLLASLSSSALSFVKEKAAIELNTVTQLGGHTFPRTHRLLPQSGTRPINIGFAIMSGMIGAAKARELEGKLEILLSSRVSSLLLDHEGGEVVGIRITRKVKRKVMTAKRTGEGKVEARVEEVGNEGDSREGAAQVEGENGEEEEEREVEVDVAEDRFCSAVVLCTGGYAADRSGLLRELPPTLSSLPTTNGDFASGDGVKMGKEVGAEAVHLDQVQVHPTGFVLPSAPFALTKFLAPEALRGYGGVLIDERGRRFVNELDTRDKVTEAILLHGSKMVEKDESGDASSSSPPLSTSPPPSLSVAFLLLNEEAAMRFDPGIIEFYRSKGIISKFPDGPSLCASLNLPEEELRRTLEKYSQHCRIYEKRKRERSGEKEREERGEEEERRQEEEKDEFGKGIFPTEFNFSRPFFSSLVTPVLHYSMGGLLINEKAQVIKRRGGDSRENSATGPSLSAESLAGMQPMLGLFAAGEVTGGVHGGNRLAGNSLLDCVVFGRIAAQSAFSYATKTRTLIIS